MYTYVGFISVVAHLCEKRSKSFSEGLVLSCPDVNCTWFHVLAGISVPIKRNFLATDGTGNINLPGNDVDSFGEFSLLTSTTNISQCYEVCPPDGSSKYYTLWFIVIQFFRYKAS